MARPMTAAEMRTAMKKWGVQYREFPNWSTRTRPGAFVDVRGVIIHHTGSDSQSDSYLKWIFTEGRPAEGIPAPLCNVATDFDGDVWLGAIGRANHAGKGSSATLKHVTNEDYGYLTELRPGPDNTDGNAYFYGNEVRYDGGQPMTAKQYTSAVRWAAAICDHYGWSALSVIGHREWSARKIDPGKCPMNKFRLDVQALLKAGPKPASTDVTPKPPASTEDDMPYTPDELKHFAGQGVHGQKIGRTDTTFALAVEGAYKNSAAAVAAIASVGAAVVALGNRITSEDAADDAEFRAAMAKLDSTLADLKATVEAPGEPEPPKA